MQGLTTMGHNLQCQLYLLETSKSEVGAPGDCRELGKQVVATQPLWFVATQKYGPTVPVSSDFSRGDRKRKFYM